MNLWQRWVRAPQTLLLRRILFQLHLWFGIGFGVYVLVIGVTGSALLLRSPLRQWLEPKDIPTPPANAVALEGAALTARMEEVYAGYNLGFTITSTDRVRATYVVLNRDGEYLPYYFDQFTGEDLGPANPWPIKSIEWVADMHDDLFLGRNGRQINAVGGLLFVLMSLTGLFIWWQGRARWYEGLVIRRGSAHSLWWQVHAFLGFWCLLLMLAWGVSGYQLGFPRHIDRIVDWFDGDLTDDARPTALLQFFRAVHFARIGEGALVRWAWIIVSFVPALLLCTGLVVWWRRVVRRYLRTLKSARA